MRAGLAAVLAMASPVLSGVPALDTDRRRDRLPWTHVEEPREPTKHDDERIARAEAKRARKAARAGGAS
jgi:hypothetical protein